MSKVLLHLAGYRLSHPAWDAHLGFPVCHASENQLYEDLDQLCQDEPASGLCWSPFSAPLLYLADVSLHTLGLALPTADASCGRTHSLCYNRMPPPSPITPYAGWVILAD